MANKSHLLIYYNQDSLTLQSKFCLDKSTSFSFDWESPQLVELPNDCELP